MDRFDIEITGSGSELQGVGRLPDGRAVFVPGAIPGERVRIEITADKGRFCEASLVDVLQSSPDRVQPDCPHAGKCGGCQARHMTYARTLELKRQRVYDALTRIGGFEHPEVRETLGCEQVNRTRNKAEYPIALQNGRMVVGAFTPGGKTVIGLQDCLSQTEESILALNWLSAQLNTLPFANHLKYLVTRTNREGKLMVILSGVAPLAAQLKRLSPTPACVQSLWYCQLNRRHTHALDGVCTQIWGKTTIKDRLFDLEFELSPQSFFQVNAPQAEVLYTQALQAAGITAGCEMNVLDAYCGVGTITLSAARFARSVIGIEVVPPAIENAHQNARLNGMQNTRFICADAAKEIPRLLTRGQNFDAAILDPPRKGVDPSLLEALAKAKIPTIAYISCNPATLARDLKYLHLQNYHLQPIQPVDMFPWTGHVETIALLSLK